MQDDFIAKGQPKYSKPTAGNAPTIPMPVYGIVKDNFDETRQGIIKVYVSDGTASDPNDRNNWKKAMPLGFYGKTNGDPPNTGFGTYKTNPSSYGVWHSPPDIGTKVVVIFVNGDPNFGYYLGGVYDPDAMHMIPAIAGAENVLMNSAEAGNYGGALVLPVTNLNNNSDEASSPSNYIDAPKPVHSYVASILNQQGLIRDPIRGVISSSSQREAASRVGWGVATPGRPIYEGGFDDTSIAAELSNDSTPATAYKVVARRGGHTIVMDDGDIIGRNQLVRIRSAMGHQITMSDDGQTLFIIHSNGQSYIELGKEGTVDIYSTNSFNVRTMGDLNLHADNNINIHAEKQLNIRAENIHVQSDGAYKLKVLKDYNEAIGGKLTSLVGGAYAVSAGGQASMVASAEAFVNGTKVNLNSGNPATTPEDVAAIKAFAHTDTLFDKQKGFMAAPGKLVTIASRAPAHTPWANAGQGVDVQVDLGATASLPEAPSAPLSDVNQAAAGAVSPNDTPAISSGAVQPSSAAVSGALDKNTTSVVLGSIAQDAAKSPQTAAAVSQGAGIVNAPDGSKTVVTGQYASTPQQLQTAGTLKPGSAPLIQSLVEQGKSVANAMPSTLFTGKPGAENLAALSNNVQAQAGAVTKNMQTAQTALTNAGVITGKESGSQIAGVIKSGATAGVDATIAAVKSTSGLGNIGSSISNTVKGAASGLTSGVGKALKAIGSGNLAGSIADGVTSGLGSLKNSLAGLASAKGLSSVTDAAKGVAASAFAAIKNSFPKLPAGKPVNIKEAAKAAAAQAETAAGTVAGAATNTLNALTGPASGLANAAKGAVSGLQNQMSGGAAALGKALPGAAPGGNAIQDFQKGAASVLGSPKPSLAGVISQVSGTVASLAGNAKTGAIAGAVSGIAGASQGGLAGALTQGVTGAVQGAISGQVNAVLDKATGGLATKVLNASTAINAITGITPSGAAGAFGPITAVTNAVTGSVAAVKSTIAGSVSSLASGLTNLPGGAGAAGALQNNIKGAAGAAAGALGAAAGKLGGSVSGLAGLASGIKDKATAALNNLKPPSLDAAAALSKSGLPAGLASQLESQISAIGSGGGVPISMPTIAVNTTNRAEISEATGALLGDPGIPTPQFGEVAESTVSTLQEAKKDRTDQLQEVGNAASAANSAYFKASKLGKKFDKLKVKLPPGDPKLQQAYDEYMAACVDYDDKDKAFRALRTKYGLD